MVTILIPTAKRPELLANALQSISEQTALNEVKEIIVSESAGDPRSGEICKKFPHLPIQYILREPRLQMTEHFAALKKARWKGDYTAILHDDDWWTPDFLRHALDALTKHPQASSFCCASFDVDQESSILKIEPNFCFWLGANYPPFRSIWELGTEAVFLACLLGTPAHYSTIVARADALCKATVVYDTDNRWDADRMLIFELSRVGPVAYSALPYAFCRHHPNQLTHTYSITARNKQMALTTEWLIQQSGETWETAGRLFSAQSRKCPSEALGYLHHAAMVPWCLPLLAYHAGMSSEVGKLYRSFKPSFFKNLLKLLIPPIISKAKYHLQQALTK